VVVVSLEELKSFAGSTVAIFDVADTPLDLLEPINGGQPSGSALRDAVMGSILRSGIPPTFLLIQTHQAIELIEVFEDVVSVKLVIHFMVLPRLGCKWQLKR
jgi:hypothetical protein